jgi:hypothetical protein
MWRHAQEHGHTLSAFNVYIQPWANSDFGIGSNGVLANNAPGLKPLRSMNTTGGAGILPFVLS